MNKKIIVSLLSFVTFQVNASDYVPLPDKGIQIVPLSKMDLPESSKNELLDQKIQQNEKGYYQSDDKYIRFLLLINKNAPSEIFSFKSNKNNFDTHLKYNLSQIKLAFSFSDFINKDNLIGYAPIGTYIKDKGWTGIKEFFNDKNLGTCAYSFFNLKLTNGGAQLSKEDTQYLVNNKPTNTSVYGNVNTGFVYNIEWFDNEGWHILDCAKKYLDRNALYQVITYANKIDKE